MKIEILQEAERDLTEGFQFYECQQAGLGEYFLDTLASDIDSLQLFAGVHSKHGNYLRLLSRRFPYAVYYKMNQNTVFVCAVLDCRRDPYSNQARLE
jgi:plasmid stabilization system protein ParE